MAYQLSVIVVSYNTRNTTCTCLSKIGACLESRKIPHEIIVVDNASKDGSVEAIGELQNPRITLISSPENVGYGRANNKALAIAKGDFVLYLNSDVYIESDSPLEELIRYLEQNKEVGGLTCRVQLSNGKDDPASHRGFPTVWRSLCYFAGAEKVFGSVPILNYVFGGYHLLHLDRATLHEIDSPTGAFFLCRRTDLIELGGFDEDYFMYGEDLDLAYRMKGLGKKIVYYPLFSVLHLKGASGIHTTGGNIIANSTRAHFYRSMGIFYEKHYAKDNPGWMRRVIMRIIDLLVQRYETNRN